MSTETDRDDGATLSQSVDLSYLFGLGGGDVLILSDLFDHFFHALLTQSDGDERRCRVGIFEETEQKMVDGRVAILLLFGKLLRLFEHIHERAIRIDLAWRRILFR